MRTTSAACDNQKNDHHAALRIRRHRINHTSSRSNQLSGTSCSLAAPPQRPPSFRPKKPKTLAQLECAPHRHGRRIARLCDAEHLPHRAAEYLGTGSDDHRTARCNQRRHADANRPRRCASVSQTRNSKPPIKDLHAPSKKGLDQRGRKLLHASRYTATRHAIKKTAPPILFRDGMDAARKNASLAISSSPCQTDALRRQAFRSGQRMKIHPRVLSSRRRRSSILDRPPRSGLTKPFALEDAKSEQVTPARSHNQHQTARNFVTSGGDKAHRHPCWSLSA